jgi:hypothetical protein
MAGDSGRIAKAREQSDEELLEALCDALQTLGSYKGPRTESEIKLIVRGTKLREQVLQRMGERASAIKEAKQEEAEQCAQIAMGMTGPGNTPEQCQGYSDACRDIAKAIRKRGER